MKRGKSEFRPHTVGLMGEYLVAAKLLELGWENVSIAKDASYDLIACYQDKIIRIDVTGKGKGEWSFDAKKFLDIKFDEKSRVQKISKNKDKAFKKLELDYFILVKRNEKDVFRSKFYIVPAKELADIIYDRYTANCPIDGDFIIRKRPKNWKSTHATVGEKM